MIWLSRFLLLFAIFGFGVFAIGMGDDMPTPIAFTLNPDINLAIFHASWMIALVCLITRELIKSRTK